MSQQNVDLIAERLNAFQAALRITDQVGPDFVWDMSTVEGWPDTREYFGPEGFDAFFAKWTEAYDEFEQRSEAVIDAGDAEVVSVVRQRGRPKGSQSWVDLRFGIVWTVSEGDVKRAKVFRTAEEALEAAGLSE